jgi:uncharacterized protein
MRQPCPLPMCHAQPLHRRWRLPMEFGSFQPLLVRTEHFRLGLARSVRILYASDLHLGHWWTKRLPYQLLVAVQETHPDLILLGGDLVDRKSALPQLGACVANLREQAPVFAIPGNHDTHVGIPALRTAIISGGGRWLPDDPLRYPVRIDGTLDPRPSSLPRILCAHFPSIFPSAVAAGYRLVLAGHLHGGQCVLVTHQSRLYPAAWFHRWHGLRFRERDALMLVSRGAADTFPFRFNCPREVILCEIS